MLRLPAQVILLTALGSVALIASCGSDGSNSNGTSGNGTSGTSGNGSNGSFPPGSSGGDGGDPGISAPIEITPVDQVVTFTAAPGPTVQYAARLIDTKQAVPAIFSIDRGEIGTINPTTGLFSASGGVGGKAKITATYRGTAAVTTVTVKVKVVENGGVQFGDAGAGGAGGVGGHGEGVAVTPAVLTDLHKAPVADAGLSILYPYDGTVWPRGILAPLLMWKPGAQATYDAVLIKLTETNYEYEGAFAANDPAFRDHPIPQGAWKALTQSNEGEEATVSLTFAKGGVAYGPVTMKWKIASAPLKGVVYYNSYGTRLAKNYGNVGDEQGALPDPRTKFGGATLAIRGSSTEPALVAGGNGDKSYCRVCHSVAANGSSLITQRQLGGDRLFSTYTLTGATNVETQMTPEGGGAGGNAKFAWPAIYPDGSIFLGDSSTADGSNNGLNQLYEAVSGGGKKAPTALNMVGWPNQLRAAFPAFAPDGKKLAFTVFSSAGAEDKRTLSYMTFDRATNGFGALTELHKPANAAHSAIYPAFLPTNDAVVYQLETAGNGRDFGGTRATADGATTGAHGELWWVKVPANATDKPQPVALEKLNGKGYIPLGPNEHDVRANEETLNYEPTVNPVPSGGYAWVVFTSRRLYGNVATINPFYSDPRYSDISKNPTPKKLWVAAIDLNAAPGTDPSHPAFYLPAQELLAGNQRGYWVVDPCKQDGNGCETGDECCGGFCRPNQAGALVCSNVVPTCSQEYERCGSSAECCGNPTLTCINSRCAKPGPVR